MRLHLQRHAYETRKEKHLDFFKGIAFVILLNLVMLVLEIIIGGIYYFDQDNAILLWMVQLVPWILNSGFFVYYGFTRYWIAQGALGVFAVLLLVDTGLSTGCFNPFDQIT